MNAVVLIHPAVLRMPFGIDQVEHATGMQARWIGRHAELKVRACQPAEPVRLDRAPRYTGADVTDVSDYIGAPPRGAA